MQTYLFAFMVGYLWLVTKTCKAIKDGLSTYMNSGDAQFNINPISLIFASCANNSTIHQKLGND